MKITKTGTLKQYEKLIDFDMLAYYMSVHRV